MFSQLHKIMIKNWEHDTSKKYVKIANWKTHSQDVHLNSKIFISVVGSTKNQTKKTNNAKCVFRCFFCHCVLKRHQRSYLVFFWQSHFVRCTRIDEIQFLISISRGRNRFRLKWFIDFWAWALFSVIFRYCE